LGDNYKRIEGEITSSVVQKFYIILLSRLDWSRSYRAGHSITKWNSVSTRLQVWRWYMGSSEFCISPTSTCSGRQPPRRAAM